jgi:hypothetical protein
MSSASIDGDTAVLEMWAWTLLSAVAIVIIMVP